VRRGGRPRRRVHARDGGALRGGVRARDAARDRRRDRRRRRRLSLRAPALRRPRAPALARPRRTPGAARRGRLVDADPRHAHAGDVEGAARLLGRPLEVEGVVVGGDRRGGTLGFPTANLAVDPQVLVPAFGIYAGAVGDRRAAVSIGVNPHYGGTERRVEAYLLDWEGDLYGKRLVVELWRRLRDVRAFASEADLVAQIARDVEDTRAATRPGD
jgi:hypothetical protein